MSKKKKRHNRPNPGKPLNATPFKSEQPLQRVQKEWKPRGPKLTLMQKLRLRSKKILAVTASLAAFGVVVTSMSGLVIPSAPASTTPAGNTTPNPSSSGQPVDLGNGSNVVKVTIPKDGGDPIVEPVDPNESTGSSSSGN